MEGYKFKVGDIVIGNKKANSYSISVEGWKGRITRLFTDFFEAKRN